jgi:hypothetical protein
MMRFAVSMGWNVPQNKHFYVNGRAVEGETAQKTDTPTQHLRSYILIMGDAEQKTEIVVYNARHFTRSIIITPMLK